LIPRENRPLVNCVLFFMRSRRAHLDTAPELQTAWGAAFTPLQRCQPQNQSFRSFTFRHRSGLKAALRGSVKVRPRTSAAEQFFHLLARRRFTRIIFSLGLPIAPGELKILAEIPDRLFEHRFRAAFAALLGHARIVAGTVQAYPQVGAAFHADLAAPRLPGDRPNFTAVVAMPLHLNLRLLIYVLRLEITIPAPIVNRKPQNENQ
jgi:hypothetical protein